MADARISQETLEVVVSGQPAARISQETLEVVINAAAAARVSQLTLEVVVPLSNGSAAPTALRMGLAIT